MADELATHEQTVGRYMLFGQIGAGGMGAVHLGRRIGPAGFSRLVAIKRLHPHLAKDRELVHSFLDEARIAARVSHPNVVSIDDVVISGNEVLLVMEYVKGQSLAFLASAERKVGRSVPPRIAAAIAVDMLHGLQAAHDARDERGRLLGVIHRDVSPQNVLVGVDGIGRVLDFGIAKALGRLQTTQEGSVKGKLAYMAPERLSDRETTASVDIYAAAIVIWELLAGQRYFEGPSSEALIPLVIDAKYKHLRDPALAAIDRVLERALSREPAERHATCSALAADVERLLALASRNEITEWVERIARVELAASEALVADVECSSTPSPAPVSQGSRTLTSRTSPTGDVAPPTVREAPPPTLREAPPTVRDAPFALRDAPAPRLDRAPKQPDTSTQLTSEATVSDVARGTTSITPRSKLLRNVLFAAAAGGVAVAVVWGGISLARAKSPAGGVAATVLPPSVQAPESSLPLASATTSGATSLAAVSSSAPQLLPVTSARGDEHAPVTSARGDERARPPKSVGGAPASSASAGSGKTAAPATPASSASASKKPTTEPEAPTDRK